MEGGHLPSLHIEERADEVDLGGEISIENAKNCSDDADDWYSKNDYHSVHSSEDDCSPEEVDEVECVEGAIYNTDFDNPELHLRMNFNDVK